MMGTGKEWTSACQELSTSLAAEDNTGTNVARGSFLLRGLHYGSPYQPFHFFPFPIGPLLTMSLQLF